MVAVAKIMDGERPDRPQEAGLTSVGQPLSVNYCLGPPWVEVTGCNHKAKCPLAFGLVRPSLPGQWDALVIRISFLHVHKY